MNRRTLAVIGLALALVVVGGAVLYGRTGAPPPPAPAAAQAKVDKAKTKAPVRKTEAQRSQQRPIPANRPPAPKDAPNVVVLVMSTQRRDQWSVYDSGVATTPFLAEQAKQGVTMTDGLAVAVDCAPGLAALLTGRYPHQIGVVDPAPVDGPLALAPRASTLAERFASAGWHTIGLTSTHELNRSRGGDQGFDVYVDAQDASYTAGMRTGAQEIVKGAIARIAARKEPAKARPLYLQLVFSDSHKPMIKLSPAESEAFADPDFPDLGPYRATIKRQDDAIAALVTGLANQGISADNTLFVVVADHGEGLKVPARHRLQHGLVFYESSVAVPWVWWGRGIPRGKRVDGPASTVDFAPTLLALAGSKDSNGDGMDLSAAVRAGSKSPRKEAYSDTYLQGFVRASVWTTEFQCQQDYGSANRPPDDDFAPGCFDRRADPEFERVIARPDLADRLETWHEAREAEIGGTSAAR